MNFKQIYILFLFVAMSAFYSSVNAQVENPILSDFYPDPSICRVGNDYYLVNSSFSYFPGVLIFQSTDLVYWKQIGHVLDRIMLVNGGSDLEKKPIWIEGPHIYQDKGYYYLLADEGGTGVEHSEVIFRSKNIWGAYEVAKINPILT